MGYADAFDYPNAEAVYEEIRRFHNPVTGYDLRGIGYAELRTQPRQWPCAPGSEQHRSPLRYLNDGSSQALLLDARGRRPALAFPPLAARRASLRGRGYRQRNCRTMTTPWCLTLAVCSTSGTR